MDIKTARESKNMTQEQLANVLKVSRSTVAMWESNTVKPRANTLIELSKLFSCSVDELLGMENNSEGN